MFSKMQLGYKLLIPILTIIFVGVGISTVFSFVSAEKSAFHQMESQSKQTSTLVQNIVKDWLTSRNREIETLSKGDQYAAALKSGFLGKAAKRSSSQELTKIRDNNKAYLDIAIADLTGETIAASSDSLIGQNIQNQEYFQSAQNGKPYTSKVKLNNNKKPSLFIAFPINKDDAVAGVIYAQTDIDYFNQQFIRPIRIGKEGFAFIINQEGKFISHKNKDYILAESIVPFAKEILSQKTGVKDYTDQGHESIASFQPFDEKNWIIGITLKKDEVFEQARQQGLTSIVLGFLVGLLSTATVYFLAKNLIIKPVQSLEATSKELASGNLDASVDTSREDELGRLAKGFEAMRNAIKEKITEIEEHNRTLDIKVKERTAELTQKKNDIETMLQNLVQGIFTVLEDKSIHNEYSQHTEVILGQTKLAGKDISDLLFSNSNLTKPEIAEAITALNSTLGEDILGFELNSHLMVNELVIKTESGHKTLEIEWIPIETDDIVHKLMVSLRDVTLERELLKKNQEQEAQMKVMVEILDQNPEEIERFLERSFEYISDNKQRLKQARDENNLNIMFRNMHTIKGNSKTLKLSLLASPAHEAEETYDKLRKDPSVSVEISSLEDDLNRVLEALNTYKQSYNDLKKRLSTSTQGQTSGEQGATEALLEGIKAQLETISPQAADIIELHIKEVSSVSLESLLAPIVRSTAELADSLEKPPPIINLDHSSIKVDKEIGQIIFDTTTHILRNSLDHGIEAPKDRLPLKKSEHGSIEIKFSAENNTLSWQIQDDGRGLDLTKLRQKLDNGNNLSDQEVAESIFEAGLSTASKVTDISGRGVGMDAVKHLIEDAGGKVSIRLLGENALKNHSFVIVLSLPLERQAAMKAS